MLGVGLANSKIQEIRWALVVAWFLIPIIFDFLKFFMNIKMREKGKKLKNSQTLHIISKYHNQL